MKNTVRIVASTLVAASGSSSAAVLAELLHATPAGAESVTHWSSGETFKGTGALTAWFENAADEDFGIFYFTEDSWEMEVGVAWQNYKVTTGSTWWHYDLLTQDYWSGTIDVNDTGDPDYILPTKLHGEHATGYTGKVRWTGSPTQRGCGPFTDRDTPSYMVTQPCTETAANGNGFEYLYPQVSHSESIESSAGNYFFDGDGYTTVTIMDTKLSTGS